MPVLHSVSGFEYKASVGTVLQFSQGCGAFRNKPEIVARAYKEIISEFQGRFVRIEFAVYCPPQDSRNYEVFRRVLMT